MFLQLCARVCVVFQCFIMRGSYPSTYQSHGIVVINETFENERDYKWFFYSILIIVGIFIGLFFK